MTFKLLFGSVDMLVTILTRCVWTNKDVCLTTQTIINEAKRRLVIFTLQMTNDGGLTVEALGMPAGGVFASQDRTPPTIIHGCQYHPQKGRLQRQEVPPLKPDGMH